MYFYIFSSYYILILIHQYISIFLHTLSLSNKYSMLSFSRNKHLLFTIFFSNKFLFFLHTLSRNKQLSIFEILFFYLIKRVFNYFSLHLPSNESSILSSFWTFMESFILFTEMITEHIFIIHNPDTMDNCVISTFNWKCNFVIFCLFLLPPFTVISPFSLPSL